MATVAILSALLSWCAIAFMLRFGRIGPVDHPNHRSLHRIPVPRSGGIGILVGSTMGFVVAPPSLPFWVALGSLVCVSLIDDYRSISAGTRLIVQILSAWLVTWAFCPSEWGAVGQAISILCIVWVTNVYNFMDGANGLAGGMAAFGFSAYAVAALLANQYNLSVWSLGVAAAAMGFLVFNLDPARIFMGDVGSIPLGFLSAVLGLQGVWWGVWPPWFPFAVFSVFLVDATATLVQRGVKGEKIWVAHCSHYYQRLIQSGWSHRRLAHAAYLVMFATGGSACLLIAAPPLAQMLAAAAWSIIYIVLMRTIDRRSQALSEKS